MSDPRQTLVDLIHRTGEDWANTLDELGIPTEGVTFDVRRAPGAPPLMPTAPVATAPLAAPEPEPVDDRTFSGMVDDLLAHLESVAVDVGAAYEQLCLATDRTDSALARVLDQSLSYMETATDLLGHARADLQTIEDAARAHP